MSFPLNSNEGKQNPRSVHSISFIYCYYHSKFESVPKDRIFIDAHIQIFISDWLTALILRCLLIHKIQPILYNISIEH